MNENINDYLPLTPDYNQERLDTLKKLFPDLFTGEGDLDKKELEKLVANENTSEVERYEFRWFGKSIAKREAFMPTDATLKYLSDKSVNPEYSENIIIEGENLNVLKLLSVSYREKVKVIYIDPPYNTGNDFVYSDNYKKDKAEYWEETGVTENGVKIDTNTDASGRYHSDWLNMMYSRLLIARQLLKEDGIIFISIDDNEVHHLRKLCDDVFGTENFIGKFAWRKKVGAGADSKLFFRQHEYILLYAKNSESLIELFQPLNDKQINEYSNPDEDNRGEWAATDLSSPAHDNDPKRIYSVVSPEGVVFEKCWAYTEKNFHQLIKDNLIWWGKEGKSMPKRKRFLKDKKGLTPRSWIDTILTQDGKKNLLDINFNYFDYPKPVNLIKHFLTIGTNKDDIILDFFAGSGTTGQAVMELNQEDGGNRKYILVQLPEATSEKSEAYKAGYKKISDITIERNKRVVDKILKEKKEKHPDLFAQKESEVEQKKGLGFKVYTLIKSTFPRTEWRPEIDKTDEENIQALKDYIKVKESQMHITFDKNDLMLEILIKRGYELNYTAEKQENFTANEIFLIKDKQRKVYLCLDDTLKDETVDYFKKNIEIKFICLQRALNTTQKWNLQHYMKDMFKPF